MDLFFRGLDDGTARTLRLTDQTAPSAHTAAQAENGGDNNEHVDNPATPNGMVQCHDLDPGLNMLLPTLSNAHAGDLEAPGDLFGLFNFSDDLSDVVGPTQDSLNLQNLESLYRFL